MLGIQTTQLQLLGQQLPSLKLTASLHLKIDGWKTIRFPFGFRHIFTGFCCSFEGGKQTNTQQHHNMILLMVQKSGNHQLSLVLYPIIYRDLAPSNPWFSCQISEPSDTLGEAIKIASHDRHWDSLHDAIPLEVLRVPQGKWMVNSGNKRRTQWSNEKGSLVV